MTGSAPDAAPARQVLAADLVLLASLDGQIISAETELARLIPASSYAALTSVPGWGVVRAAGYAAARGLPATRWASAAKIYRAAGLTPRSSTKSAGRRRDGGISREGSFKLRRALIELGIGLWQRDPGSRAYASATWRGRVTSPAASSPARWPTAPTRSPSLWSTTRARSTRPAGAGYCFLPSRRSGGGMLGEQEGRIRRRDRYEEPLGVTSLLAWRPAFRHEWSSNDAR